MEAIAVTIIKLKWDATALKVLGIISQNIFLKPGDFKLNIGLYLNPLDMTDGSCTNQCKNAPKTAPKASPFNPKIGKKKNIPNIIPRL